MVSEIKSIKSFKVDHTKLCRGVYVSCYDTIGEFTITTFDIRMKTPYKELPLSPEVSHTIEHLAASWLRNSYRKNDIIYFGPMGCLTGFYLIIKGKYTAMQFKWYLASLFRWMSTYEGEIPGATIKECGNYKLNNLEKARDESKIFLTDVVLKMKENNTKYPE